MVHKRNLLHLSSAADSSEMPSQWLNMAKSLLQH